MFKSQSRKFIFNFFFIKLNKFDFLFYFSYFSLNKKKKHVRHLFKTTTTTKWSHKSQFRYTTVFIIKYFLLIFFGNSRYLPSSKRVN